MRRLVLITALLAAAPAASADAASRWIVKGGGWGHGLGMSQYGAYGQAKAGRGYRKILAHYYRGTRIGPAPRRDVRVLLQASVGTSAFSGATRAGRKQLAAGRRYTVHRNAGAVVIRNNRGKRVIRSGGVITVASSRGPIRVEGKGRYRGAMEYRPGASGGVTAVNRVSLDEYVQGVVPNESPSSWPLEALKAQAVAARSYAVSTKKTTSGVFDHYDTTASQVYGGYDSEAASSNRAVAATRNQVLRHQGEVATTFYFSTSGGHTENNENVWGGAPVPYLRGVPDPWDKASPYHRWRLAYTPQRLGSSLGVGRIRGARVLKRGASPRIVRVRVRGTGGSQVLHGQTVKARLGLRDAPSAIKRIGSRGSSAGAAAAGVDSRGSAHVIRGRITPARAGQPIRVERQTRSGWRAVARGELEASGRYHVALPRPGVHRVLSGGDAGPAVRVR